MLFSFLVSVVNLFCLWKEYCVKFVNLRMSFFVWVGLVSMNEVIVVRVL